MLTGDSMFYHVRQQFSTYDQDNDAGSGYNCAKSYRGAWWYKDCHESNLNGFYYGGPHNTSRGDGIEWETWTGRRYSLKTTEMKIKPAD
jgi:ficolin